MAAEVIFPDDSRWRGTKRLTSRVTVSISTPRMAELGYSHGCESPPGPDVLVLWADDLDTTYSQITLTFNGTGVMLFGTQLGAPASFDLDPSPTTVTSTSTGVPITSLPIYNGPEETISSSDSAPASTGTLAPVNCDFALTTLSGLVDSNHTLRVSLQAQGLLYIYNATVEHGLESPARSTTSDTAAQLPRTPITRKTRETISPRLAQYVALPLGCITLLVVGVLAVWLRWKRRKRTTEIRAYGLFVPASEAGTLASQRRPHERKVPFFTDKALPCLPPAAARMSSAQDPAALSDLGRAVEQAGFSVTALVTSLRLVHRAGVEVEDADILGDHLPEYDHSASR